ncbi:MAG: hypothetical protein IJ058_04935, partial [Lachnospiraceae bacterium]|nr:hypothetical protein [Lachnospiraceae bacterium]
FEEISITANTRNNLACAALRQGLFIFEEISITANTRNNLACAALRLGRFLYSNEFKLKKTALDKRACQRCIF